MQASPSSQDTFRQSPQPKFQISGDLNPHQVGIVKRTWKQLMKSLSNNETEVAIRLLTRIFLIDPRNATYFGLGSIAMAELRHNVLFMRHVKAFEPTLVQVMSHPTNATSLSKHLQVLGGRHVHHTGVTYRSPYWKNFVQALVEVFCTGSNADVYDAFTVLGAFCVEQMRIGYKIEYKLQREAERIARVQLQKRESSLSNGRKF
ncbi:globin family protein [Aphelenchoides avenae]|nr:globin family protein [Aphelenchus avenae]